MNIFRLFFSIILVFTLNACNEDDSNSIESGDLVIQFNHDWNGSHIDLDQLIYENTNGDLLSISKLKYLISNFILQTPDGNSLQFNGYTLVDIDKESVFVLIPNVPFSDYSKLSFTFGFNEFENIDGAYNDLNAASWNWPEMLGGGYHFMQFEGKYEDNGNESSFAYHMGTAKASEGVFEQNFFEVELNGFHFTKPSTLNLNMNIAEWFSNPHTWDLNVYNINLMQNYDAQKMMNDNGKTIFSLGEID